MSKESNIFHEFDWLIGHLQAPQSSMNGNESEKFTGKSKTNLAHKASGYSYDSYQAENIIATLRQPNNQDTMAQRISEVTQWIS